MEVFANISTAEELLRTAYSLEEGLKDFYLSMIQRISSTEVQTLFQQLATIEDLHKDRIFSEYCILTGETDRQAFEEKIAVEVIEGGMTTDDYLDLFSADLNNATEVIALAMSIEAQALDLYTRAGREVGSDKLEALLARIASEEKNHLQQLGKLMDTIAEEKNG